MQPLKERQAKIARRRRDQPRVEVVPPEVGGGDQYCRAEQDADEEEEEVGATGDDRAVDELLEEQRPSVGERCLESDADADEHELLWMLPEPAEDFPQEPTDA